MESLNYRTSFFTSSSFNAIKPDSLIPQDVDLPPAPDIQYRRTIRACQGIVLVKKIRKSTMTRTAIAGLAHEISALILLRGQPYCMNLLTVSEDRAEIQLVFSTVLLGGVALHRVLRGMRGMEEGRSLAVLTQIGSVLQHLHSAGYAHRDIKPECIYFSLSGKFPQATLADFRAVTYVGQSGRTAISPISGVYSAPEVSSYAPYCPLAADIWALGFVAYGAAVGNIPTSDDIGEELIDRIKGGIISFPATLSRDLRRLIRYMLTPKAEDRPTVAYVVMEANRILRFRQGPSSTYFSWPVPSAIDPTDHVVPS